MFVNTEYVTFKNWPALASGMLPICGTLLTIPGRKYRNVRTADARLFARELNAGDGSERETRGERETELRVHQGRTSRYSVGLANALILHLPGALQLCVLPCSNAGNSLAVA